MSDYQETDPKKIDALKDWLHEDHIKDAVEKLKSQPNMWDIRNAGSALDQMTGAPVRVGIEEARKGNFNLRHINNPVGFVLDNWEPLKKVVTQFGKDPSTAPSGFDIASQMTDNKWLGTALATAFDLAQLPIGPHFKPGVVGEIKNIKPLTPKIIDAIDAFKERGKAPPSTEMKIKQMYGETGEVRDAMPNLLNRSLYETPAKDFKKYAKEADKVGYDIRDHSGQSPAVYSTRSAYDNPRNAPPKIDEVFRAPETPQVDQAPQQKPTYQDQFGNVFEGQNQSKVPGLYTVEEQNLLKPTGDVMLGPDADRIRKEKYEASERKRNEEWEQQKKMREKGATDRAKELSDQIKANEESMYDYHRYDEGGNYEDHLRSEIDLSNLGRNIQPLIDSALKSGIPRETLEKLLNKHSKLETNTRYYADPDHVGLFSPGEIEIQHDDIPHDLTPEEREFLKHETGLHHKEGDSHGYTYYPMDDVVHTLVPDVDKVQSSLNRLIKKQPKKPTLMGVPGEPDEYFQGGTVQPQHLAHGGGVQMAKFHPMLTPDQFQNITQQGQHVAFDDLPDDHAQNGALPDFDSLPDDSERFSGVGGMLASGALGVASGASFGLSNVALTKTGMMNPETLAQLQDNPTYTMGEIGSMFLPTGAASIIGKAGKATYSGAKALMGIREAAQGAKALSGLGKLGTVAAQAAGSAVEGAAYAGLSNSFNEYALGDPDLNAEKVMANFGWGALYGGALGGILKGAAVGAPEALGAAKEALGSVKNVLVGDGVGSKSLASKALTWIDDSEKLSDAFRNRVTNLDLDQRQELVKNVTDTLNRVKNNLGSVLKHLNGSMRPNELDALIETANKGKVLTETQTVIDTMNGVLQHMEENPALYDPQARAKLELWHSQITNNLGDQSPLARFNLLKEVKQGLQGWGRGITPTATKAETKAALNSIAQTINGVLKNPEVFGAAGSAFAKHDEILAKLYDFIAPPGERLSATGKEFKKLFLGANGDFDATKLERYLKVSEGPKGERAMALLDDWFNLQKQLPEHLESTYANIPNELWDEAKLGGLSKSLDKELGASHDFVGTKAPGKYTELLNSEKGRKLGLREIMLGGIGASHPILGGVAFAADMASRPIEYINKLAEVERLVGKASDWVDKGAKKVFIPSLKTMGKIKGPLIRQMSPENLEQHKKTEDHLTQLNNNPDALYAALNGSTSHLQDVAPNMAESLQAAMIRGNQFLQSKLPGHANLNPFEKDYEPSGAEIAQFQRYKELVNDPMSAFDQVAHSMVTPETIETLSTVYPKLFEEMKSKLLQASMDQLRKGDLPFRLKQSISQFTGTPIDRALDPMSVGQNQMIFMANPGPQMQAGAPKARPGAMKDMDAGKRLGLSHGSNIG